MYLCIHQCDNVHKCELFLSSVFVPGLALLYYLEFSEFPLMLVESSPSQVFDVQTMMVLLYLKFIFDYCLSQYTGIDHPKIFKRHI